MLGAKWVHLPFLRGKELTQVNYGSVPPLWFGKDAILSAWGLVLSSDDFRKEGRIAGVVFIKESRNRDTLRLWIGWMEHSRETRGRRSRMVADLVSLAWARWIEAQRIFLIDGKGDGVSLTRDISNEPEKTVAWALRRMRATSVKKPKLQGPSDPERGKPPRSGGGQERGGEADRCRRTRLGMVQT